MQCYKELQRPRRGMEHYWDRVNRGGMDVADKIVNAPRDQRDNPNERIEMKIKITNR